MEKSLEELSLLACLPPGVLERHGLKIIENFDNEFLTSNYKQIIELIESKINICTVIVVNNDQSTTTVIRNLRDIDVAEMLLYVLDGFVEDELNYFTLNNMLEYLNQRIDVGDSQWFILPANPTIQKVFDDFKKNIREGINLHRLVDREFEFDNGRIRGGSIEIKIIKRDFNLSNSLLEDSRIYITEDKESIKSALKCWWYGNK